MLVLGNRGQTGYVLGRSGGASNGLLTGLVAYWKLDEASGNAIDAHSNGLTLTQANSPGSNTGKVYGTARTFVAASNQYFSRNSEALLQTGNIDFVIAAWVYSTEQNREQRIAFKSTDYSITQFSSNRYGFYGALAPINSLSLNQWNLVIGWYTAGVGSSVQINNGTVYTATPAAPIASTVALSIGRETGGTGYFAGRIGPVAFWKNRTLDAAARATLWNGGNGLAYSAFS